MRRLFAVLLLLALAGGAGFFILWQDEAPMPEALAPETGTSEPEPQADIVAQSIELTQGRAGRIMWSLNATTGEYEEAAGIINLDAPRITYFLGEKREKILLGSLSGTVYQKQDRLILRNQVSGAYAQFDISADRLDYDGEVDELVLTGDVHMERAGLALDSQKAVIHLLSKNMTATGNVTAVIVQDELASAPQSGEEIEQ